jgi:hypothetical protein
MGYGNFQILVEINDSVKLRAENELSIATLTSKILSKTFSIVIKLKHHVSEQTSSFLR